MRKNIQTRTMHRSLRNGPVIKSKGVNKIIYENLLPPDAPFLAFPHGGRDCFYVNLS